ncbi:caspase domain-containing protein [Blastocladiella britannica]|nr:caspase domain-containing protein [Blastocladiella britannica]
MGGGGSAYGPGAPVPQYVPPSTPYAAPMQYTQYSVPNYAGPASVGTGHGPQQPQIEWTPTGHARIAGGRKKALLIGINYKGQQGELRGCHADVHNMKRFLTETYGFVESPQSMVVLLDDPQVHRGNAYLIPNKKSILSAMQWLVEGAQPGDSFFIHYSGHGGQQADKDGDEDDGSDETIYPLDHKSAGMITDDEMNAILVNKLPAGARLTAVFDSCHSGTALDLPFLYRPDGTLEKRAAKADRVKKSAMNAAKMAMTGGKMGLMRGAMDLFKQVSQPDQSPQDQARVTREKGSAGTVIMFSGCMDSQTSADAHIQGKATGAMSFALLKVLGSRGGMSYAQILAATREILKKDYSQIPQLSSANQIDINSVFLL